LFSHPVLDFAFQDVKRFLERVMHVKGPAEARWKRGLQQREVLRAGLSIGLHLQTVGARADLPSFAGSETKTALTAHAAPPRRCRESQF
jgi:hypothetical protein